MDIITSENILVPSTPKMSISFLSHETLVTT